MALGPDSLAGAAGEFRPGSVRGVEGFYRVAQHVTGQWWLWDPAGQPRYLRAIHGVRSEPADSEPVVTGDPLTRLRQWGFNAVGCGGDGVGREDGLAFVAGVDFTRVVPMIVAPGVRLPDVFDPDWPKRAQEYAGFICQAHAPLRELVGWVSDEALAWGQHATSGGPPGLLQVCLSLEPSFAAYHSAWEFVLALHGGRLDVLARAWGIPLANKEGVRELTRSESALATRGYLRDEAQWTREFARRYFSTTSAAIRAADPNHLLFGCRFRTPVGPHVLSAMVAPTIDAALLHWQELPPPSGTGGPILASEVGWSEESFWAPGTGVARNRLTSVERMIRRARTSLRRLARHPAVIGYIWRQWHDEPGEQPPFARGVVHLGGAEAREHTELLAEFNARAETLRRSAAKLLSP